VTHIKPIKTTGRNKRAKPCGRGARKFETSAASGNLNVRRKNFKQVVENHNFCFIKIN